MFDFHLHSTVSHDSNERAENMVRRAEELGLREICFTDHYDCFVEPRENATSFKFEDWFRAYGSLRSDKLLIRRGVEFGLTYWNTEELTILNETLRPDFIIGSVHFAYGKISPYGAEYWKTRTVDEAFSQYLDSLLKCVRAHSGYDVLGHLNYPCKSPYNPTKEPLRYADYKDVIDEILREVAYRGKGLEVNTSAKDTVGEFLPERDVLMRFRELGGEIVTVGSDAHTAAKLGQHLPAALDMIRDVFGYVCTFEGRKPIYHKL